MDISALKINVNSTSNFTPTPVVKIIPDAQVTSTPNQGDLAVKSVVNAIDNNTEKKPVKIEDVQQMTAAMNRFLQLSNANMQFAIHEKTDQIMVQFVNTTNGQVMKEFPSHEFLDTMANIRDYVGILLDKKV